MVEENKCTCTNGSDQEMKDRKQENKKYKIGMIMRHGICISQCANGLIQMWPCPHSPIEPLRRMEVDPDLIEVFLTMSGLKIALRRIITGQHRDSVNSSILGLDFRSENIQLNSLRYAIKILPSKNNGLIVQIGCGVFCYSDIDEFFDRFFYYLDHQDEKDREYANAINGPETVPEQPVCGEVSRGPDIYEEPPRPQVAGDGTGAARS